MKTRTGFVSNSSSSSFVLSKKGLTPFQIEMIKNHTELGEIIDEVLRSNNPEHFNYFDNCAWDIKETEDEITGYTSMTNFDMYYFLNTCLGIRNAEFDD